MKRECGCETRKSIPYDPQSDSYIVFCRLHEATPVLLDALGRALFHATLRGWATSKGHELADVYDQMAKAIQSAGEGYLK